MTFLVNDNDDDIIIIIITKVYAATCLLRVKIVNIITTNNNKNRDNDMILRVFTIMFMFLYYDTVINTRRKKTIANAHKICKSILSQSSPFLFLSFKSYLNY